MKNPVRNRQDVAKTTHFSPKKWFARVYKTITALDPLITAVDPLTTAVALLITAVDLIVI